MTTTAHSHLAMTDISRVISKLHELRERLSLGERAVLDDLLRVAGVAEASPIEYNPYLPDVHAQPYSHYHRLQTENPVHWSQAMQAWVISRHADVVEAFRDPRLSYRTGSETMKACIPAEEQDSVRAATALLGSLLNEIDPPDHTRLRRIMIRALTATMAPQRLAHIKAVINCLLDAVQQSGHMDIVQDLAYPLPAIIGADLLGIPAKDRDRFGCWVDDIIHTFSEGFSGTAAMLRGEEAVVNVTAYLKRLLAERRACPAQDVLSSLLEANEATEDERVLVALNIIMGMHENITHAIGLSMNTLLRNPELLHGLCRDPESLSTSVEEMLRYEGTAPILSRVALDDVEIGGVTILKGQRVILLAAAANRDADRFDDPDCFLPNRHPNPHVAFGIGRRACPGSGLARTMLQATVATLLQRFPDMQLAVVEPAWREEINIHGLRTLPVTFTPRVV